PFCAGIALALGSPCTTRKSTVNLARVALPKVSTRSAEVSFGDSTRSAPTAFEYSQVAPAPLLPLSAFAAVTELDGDCRSASTRWMGAANACAPWLSRRTRIVVVPPWVLAPLVL